MPRWNCFDEPDLPCWIDLCSVACVQLYLFNWHGMGATTFFILKIGFAALFYLLIDWLQTRSRWACPFSTSIMPASFQTCLAADMFSGSHNMDWVEPEEETEEGRLTFAVVSSFRCPPPLGIYEFTTKPLNLFSEWLNLISLMESTWCSISISYSEMRLSKFSIPFSNLRSSFFCLPKLYPAALPSQLPSSSEVFQIGVLLWL